MSFAFDASFYLLSNSDVAIAVAAGHFPDAHTHYALFGARELRNPNAVFNARDYAGLHPDVASATAAGLFASVWDHFVTFGIIENRAPSVALASFSEAGYRAANPDVATAIAAGLFCSAMEHYLNHGLAENRSWGNVVELSHSTDILSGNRFNAGPVYTPGGNDRINALQDEDHLTGIGENPTLTATLGNANDNGGAVITPILVNIQTITLAFTGSGPDRVHTLDLQDATGLTNAVHITRITDELATVAIRNMTAIPAELSIANTHSPAGTVLFSFVSQATAGTKDATSLTLANAQTQTLRLGSTDQTGGVETITLHSIGDGANRVDEFHARDLITLVITGAQDLALLRIEDGNVGSFTAIDGSAATGSLTLTLDDPLNADIRAADFTLRTGKGNDTLHITTQGLIGNRADLVDLGAGDDLVAFAQSKTTSWTDEKTSAGITGVETIHVSRTSGGNAANTTLTLDLNRLTADQGKSQSIHLANRGDTDVGGDGIATFNLNSLSPQQAQRLYLHHASSSNNALGSTVLQANLTDSAGADDSVTLTIADGLNTEPRFNFALAAAGVENITLIDSDSESGTIRLTSSTAHTGTITLRGGMAGQFLNLDWSENALGLDLSGGNADGTVIASDPLTNVGALTAAVIDAQEYVGNVIVRIGTAQAIHMGSGSDTVIFDRLADSLAGLNTAVTVSGGTGMDVLAIGGDRTIRLGASEWHGITGFEAIRLLGNGPGNSYFLTLADQFIRNNAADGKIITILNDNDPLNDAANVADAGGGAETPAIIDARHISAGFGFAYDGEEGASGTADRFVFTDASLNGRSLIDGGAADNDPTTRTGNNDVLEVRNGAVITTEDLASIKNVGMIELTNDRAAIQTVSLSLNDAVVDAMVDTYHTASPLESERLIIRSYDNRLVGGAFTSLRLDAGALTAGSDLTVLMMGRGNNSITTGAGNDVAVMLGNYDSGKYAGRTEFGQSVDELANGVVGQRMLTDTLDLGTGENTLRIYGELNTVGATLDGVTHTVIHSGLVILSSQIASMTSVTFSGTGLHELFVVFDPAGPASIDLSKITVETGGFLTFNLGAGLATTGTVRGSAFLDTTLTASTMGTLLGLSTGGSFTGTAGIRDVFQGTIGSLAGATINGNAADQEILRLLDAGTVMPGNGTDGGTISNIHILQLANGTNSVSFTTNIGLQSMAGGEGNDEVDVSGLGNSFATGDVMLNGGDDTLILGGWTYTGSFDGGAGSNSLVLADNTDISGATIANFANLVLAPGATVTMTLEQYTGFTGTITAFGTETIIFTGSGATITLSDTIEHFDFSAVTGDMTITTSATTPTNDVTITGGQGNDYITVTEAARGKTTVDLGIGGKDKIIVDNNTFTPGGEDYLKIKNFDRAIGGDKFSFSEKNITSRDIFNPIRINGDINEKLYIIDRVTFSINNIDISDGGFIESGIASLFNNTMDYSTGSGALFYFFLYLGQSPSTEGLIIQAYTEADLSSRPPTTGDFSLEIVAHTDKLINHQYNYA